MLQLIARCLPERTIIHRRSFYYTLGIFSTKETNNSNRVNFLPALPNNGYSSYSITRCLSSGKCERGLENFSDTNTGVEGESEGALKKNNISSDGDSHINAHLKVEEKRTSDFPLKINNLELFREIADGDDKVFQELLELQVRLEVTACKFGVSVNMTKEKWGELLSSSFSKRKSFVAHVIVNALRDAKKQIIQNKILYKFENHPRRVTDDYDSEEEDESSISGGYDDIQCYHLFHNSMFLKLLPKTIKKVNNSRGIAAMLYSPVVLLDCSYCSYMTKQEIKELCKQLINTVSVNCQAVEPFHVAFCNFQDQYLKQQLLKYNPKIFDNDYPVTITQKSYLDLFPKENLVYLTPHCNTILKHLEADKTYIIGAFVDKSTKKPISLGKAKEHNIAMAKFPIDKYLDWGLGNKSLSLVHVMKILLDLRIHDNNWDKAFEIIPKRFLLKERHKKPPNNLDDIIMETFDLT